MPAQLLVRAILGLYLWAAFVAFRRAASAKFGADTGAFWLFFDFDFWGFASATTNAFSFL